LLNRACNGALAIPRKGAPLATTEPGPPWPTLIVTGNTVATPVWPGWRMSLTCTVLLVLPLRKHVEAWSICVTIRFPSGLPVSARRVDIRNDSQTGDREQARPGDLSATTPSVRGQAAYSRDADWYAARTRQLHHWRLQVVDLLGLRPGATVIDVGCGSGLCFDALQQRIGPGGTIVGIDASPDMLDLARQLTVDRGWDNVVLVEAPAEETVVRGAADAVLFCAVHDVLQSPAALRKVFAHTRPGARVAAVGGKWAPPWAVGLNAMTTATHAPFVRDFTGFDQPWRLLLEHVPDLDVRQIELGCGYLASGTSRLIADDAGR
jgi:ubiquinone/menaquinone biosynthesis C-methylase UbiE